SMARRRGGVSRRTAATATFAGFRCRLLPAMSDSPYQMPRPHLQWEADGSPRSGEFDDVYFSRAGGASETDYVFLQQNRLEHRWHALDPAQPGLFTIAETGFGTGLNFLAAW